MRAVHAPKGATHDRQKPKLQSISTPMATCIENHVNQYGVLKEGDRVKADHPDVVLVPSCWADDGLPTADYHTLRLARFVNPGAGAA
jgi:hypothetical protein